MGNQYVFNVGEISHNKQADVFEILLFFINFMIYFNRVVMIHKNIILLSDVKRPLPYQNCGSRRRLRG